MKKLLIDLGKLSYHYAIGVLIIFSSLFFFAYPKMVSDNPSNDVIVFWQTVGGAVALYGFGYLMTKVIGFGGKKDQEMKLILEKLDLILVRLDQQETHQKVSNEPPLSE